MKAFIENPQKLSSKNSTSEPHPFLFTSIFRFGFFRSVTNQLLIRVALVVRLGHSEIFMLLSAITFCITDSTYTISIFIRFRSRTCLA